MYTTTVTQWHWLSPLKFVFEGTVASDVSIQSLSHIATGGVKSEDLGDQEMDPACPVQASIRFPAVSMLSHSWPMFLPLWIHPSFIDFLYQPLNDSALSSSLLYVILKCPLSCYCQSCLMKPQAALWFLHLPFSSDGDQSVTHCWYAAINVANENLMSFLMFSDWFIFMSIHLVVDLRLTSILSDGP
jgi:hypothetical protein